MSSISTLLVLLQTSESLEAKNVPQMKLQPTGGHIQTILHLNSHHLAEICFIYRKVMKKTILNRRIFWAVWMGLRLNEHNLWTWIDNAWYFQGIDLSHSMLYLYRYNQSVYVYGQNKVTFLYQETLKYPERLANSCCRIDKYISV